MIILLANGRLGNQLFQYSFIRKQFSAERILLVGFDEVSELCNLDNVFLIPQKYFGQITYRIFRGAISLLGMIRLISGIEEDASESKFTLIKKRGLIFNLILIRNSFFQHEKCINDMPLSLEIKSEYQEKAKFLLDQILAVNPRKELVFIHIRRGDYIAWPSPESPAVLSAKWIFDAVGYFKNKLASPIFLVFTDDRHYVKDVFSGKDDIIVMDPQSPASDLAMMSLCNFGILSASTFSWWAANFARKRLSETKDYEYVAPNFWAGHASGKWFPENFYTKWLHYLAVN